MMSTCPGAWRPSIMVQYMCTEAAECRYVHALKAFSEALLALRAAVATVLLHPAPGAPRLVLDLGLGAAASIHPTPSGHIPPHSFSSAGLTVAADLRVGDSWVCAGEAGLLEAGHKHRAHEGRRAVAMGARFAVDTLVRAVMRFSPHEGGSVAAVAAAPVDVVVRPSINCTSHPKSSVLIFSLMEYLRSRGYRAVSSLHELICSSDAPTSDDPSETCERLRIPFLIRVGISAKPSDAFEVRTSSHSL